MKSATTASPHASGEATAVSWNPGVSSTISLSLSRLSRTQRDYRFHKLRIPSELVAAAFSIGFERHGYMQRPNLEAS
ncbi:uncharacterized protein M6B38_366105 [Iris pallida]|uniref:Uncharacterized protein n=1 Tax=Iris pallida TaxID=29817 RepID=A0AAX6GI12_IRIPA|nr:uncharacterized protein M6B38_366105 [Iris pallida]